MAEEDEMLTQAQAMEGASLQNLLNTPRTKEALKRTGILPKDLQIKAFQDFYVPGDLKERQRLRFNHYETRRQEQLNKVLECRAQVIADQVNKPNVCRSHASLQMMECLLDQEAKRLEKDLRAQLRAHTAVEQQNERQLQLERSTQKRLAYRSERVYVAKAQVKAKASQIRQILKTKKKHYEAMKKRLEEQFEEDQVKFHAQLAEKEVQLAMFHDMKSREQHDKSSKWREKIAQQDRRREEVELELQVRAEIIKARFAKKCSMIEQKKAEEKKQLLIKQQDASLKLIDAKRNQAQIIRQDQFRREKIKENLEEQQARVETLQKLREQILKQRQNRRSQQAVSNGRAVTIASVTPGPADYASRYSAIYEKPVPKISDSKVKTTMEVDYDKKTFPAPGQYTPMVMANGETTMDFTHGVGMAKSKSKNFVSQVMDIARKIPGPGQYNQPQSSVIKEQGVKMKRNYVPADYSIPPEGSPGPAAYCTDEYLRQQNFAGINSLPALERALKLEANK